MSRSHRNDDTPRGSESPTDQLLSDRDSMSPPPRQSRRDRSRSPYEKRVRSRSPTKHHRDRDSDRTKHKSSHRSRRRREESRSRSRSRSRSPPPRKRGRNASRSRSPPPRKHRRERSSPRPSSKDRRDLFSPGPASPRKKETDDTETELVMDDSDAGKIYTNVKKSYFKHHKTTTRAQMDMINDNIIKVSGKDSYEANRQKGYRLVWASIKVSKKDARSSKQMYLTWVDENGTVPPEHAIDKSKKREMVPPLKMVYPAGPLKSVRLTITNMEDKYVKTPYAIDQHVYVGELNPDKDSDDYKLHERYYVAMEELQKVFCEDFALYMGDMNNHSYFTDEERARYREDPIVASREILETIVNPNNNKHRFPKFMTPSHHFSNKPKNLEQKKKSAKSDFIMKRMDVPHERNNPRHQRVMDLIRPSNADLTPLSVVLRNGINVDLRDLSKIHGYNAIGSVCVCIWGIYEREDAGIIQHGVIIRCQQLQVYNNGEEEFSTHVPPADCTDLYADEDEDEDSAKKPANGEEQEAAKTGGTVEQQSEQEKDVAQREDHESNTQTRTETDEQVLPSVKTDEEHRDRSKRKHKSRRHTKKHTTEVTRTDAMDDDDAIFDGVPDPLLN